MTASPTVPMVDLREQYQTLKREIDDALARVLDSTHFIMGENVRQFEAEAAKALDCEHAVSCANGTDALHLALRALDLGPGDEVITTPFTFIATAEAIAYVGATPVFVDIDERTMNIDVQQVAEAISERTRALLPVHLFGLPAEFDVLQELAERHDLAIVEDCAQSFGARWRQRPTGSLGRFGCFSFFPSKNLGAFGDGGMVTTNDEVLAGRVRVLRTHGSEVRYYHSVVGYNSRLDEMQAAILRAKLPHIERWNAERLRVARSYCARLDDLELTLPELQSSAGDDPVFHQFTLRCRDRDGLHKRLAEAGISSAVYYPVPLHRQEAIRAHLVAEPECPVAEAVCQECLSLPIYPELDEPTIERIAGVVREHLA